VDIYNCITSNVVRIMYRYCITSNVVRIMLSLIMWKLYCIMSKYQLVCNVKINDYRAFTDKEVLNIKCIWPKG
jgi:hypothetical protein